MKAMDKWTFDMKVVVEIELIRLIAGLLKS